MRCVLAYAALNYEKWNTESVFIFEIALKMRMCRGNLQKNICLLEQAIREGSLKEVALKLEAVVSDIDRETEPLAQKYSYFVLTQTLSELLEELGYEKAKLNKVFPLFFQDIKAFEKNVMNVIRNVKVETENPANAILLYIIENFRDGTMGLDALAAKFHLSVSAVSKKIKEQTGLNYTEHVSKLRIEEACRLLDETDLSIKEITYQVGYSDYGSFSKKFKAAKGMSPAEYRENCHRKLDEQQL